MVTCPCCSDLLLRHARRGESYYLCQRCRIEVPIKSKITPTFRLEENLPIPLPTSFSSVVADLTGAAQA